MSPEAAMEQYIVLVSDRAPGWMEDKPGVGIFHCSVLFPIMTLTEKSLWLKFTLQGDSKPGSSEVTNPVAVTPDLSTFSSRQPDCTEAMYVLNVWLF
jgi:hypothetical protein